MEEKRKEEALPHEEEQSQKKLKRVLQSCGGLLKIEQNGNNFPKSYPNNHN